MCVCMGMYVPSNIVFMFTFRAFGKESNFISRDHDVSMQDLYTVNKTFVFF